WQDVCRIHRRRPPHGLSHHADTAPFLALDPQTRHGCWHPLVLGQGQSWIRIEINTLQKVLDLLKNVINLGIAPSCAADLEAAFQALTLNGQSTEPFGVGRAVLSGEGKGTKSLFPSIVMVREGSLSLVDSNGFEIVLAKGEAASL